MRINNKNNTNYIQDSWRKLCGKDIGILRYHQFLFHLLIFQLQTT